MPSTDCSIKHIRQPITPSQRRRCKQFFLVIFLLRPQTMATELEVSKSRRFDIAMSRRTRRSTSLVACFQDQYVPPLTQHQHQDAKLKALFQCQDAELQVFKHFEDAEQQTPCLYEDEELRISRAPLQYEDDEEKTLEQYEDEQEKEPGQYQDHEQKKPEQHHGGDDKKPEKHKDGEDMKPDQYLDYKKKPQQYQYGDDNRDEKQVTPKEYGYDGKEKTPEQFQDGEHEASEQCQEADELTSEQYVEEGEEQKAQPESCELEKKTPERRQGARNLPAPPSAIDGVPRFSLQELIQEKQLPAREARLTSKLGGHEENVLADQKISGSGGAIGGTTLAMVIRRPEGGKKLMGMIRRCVKALNQMIKAKHGSKKNSTL